jgi:hypothetical protein
MRPVAAGCRGIGSNSAEGELSGGEESVDAERMSGEGAERQNHAPCGGCGGVPTPPHAQIVATFCYWRRGEELSAPWKVLPACAIYGVGRMALISAIRDGDSGEEGDFP